MRTLTTLLLASSLALVACKKDEKEAAAPAKPADAAAAPVAPADAAAAAATDTLSKETGNCPSTIVGVETALDAKASTDGKVVLTITTKDEGAVPTIRARAKHLVTVQGAPADTVKHTGEGTGGGKLGICPVYGDKIAVEETEGGVTVTLEGVDQAEVEKRIKQANDWVAANIKQEGAYGEKGGDGGYKGGHGGNRTGKGDASGPRTGGDKAGTGGGTGEGDGSGPGDEQGGGKK